MDAVKNLFAQINVGTVVSVVVGLTVFGGITYVAVKSGIKPLANAAKVVK